MPDKGQSPSVTLAECPPGVFEFDGSLGFKTEYGMTLVDENGANMPGDQVRWKVTSWPDAYCLESGEVFWGGTKTHEDRAKLLVRPVESAALQSSGYAEMERANARLREALEETNTDLCNLQCGNPVSPIDSDHTPGCKRARAALRGDREQGEG